MMMMIMMMMPTDAYFMPNTFSSGSDPDRMPSFSLLQSGSGGAQHGSLREHWQILFSEEEDEEEWDLWSTMSFLKENKKHFQWM